MAPPRVPQKGALSDSLTPQKKRTCSPAKFLLLFSGICTILKSTCAGVLELVDEADSKTSSPSVAGVGKSPGKSSVFRILFFICLSHPSCISLQIPGNACPGVKKYICRCVGIGRRGGLKIRWANNSCGFDPRHRHHICSEVSCFGAFFTAQKQNIEHFSETPGELHLQTKPYWKNPNVCKYWK